MNPEDYLIFCQNGVSKSSLERGHLQDLVSVNSATKLRNVTLTKELDLDPFGVLMYSDAQLKLLKTLGQEDDELKFFFDATGSVARHAKKRVFYYAGICCVKKNKSDDKEKARLQPEFELLSGEHDAKNLRLLLEEYKDDLQMKYPQVKWPIRYTVTDFSFALMNAICCAWNGVTHSLK